MSVSGWACVVRTEKLVRVEGEQLVEGVLERAESSWWRGWQHHYEVKLSHLHDPEEVRRV